MIPRWERPCPRCLQSINGLLGDEAEHGHAAIAEIVAVIDLILVVEDAQRRKPLQQFVFSEPEARTFKDHDSARTEGLDDFRRVVGRNPTEQNQIPFFFAEVEVAVGSSDAGEFQAEVLGALGGKGDSSVRGVKACDVPPKLREKKRIAPFAHSDIQCTSTAAMFHHRGEEAVGRGVELMIAGGQESIPDVPFQVGTAGTDQLAATVNLRRRYVLPDEPVAITAEYGIHWRTLVRRQGEPPLAKLRIEVELLHLRTGREHD